MIYLDYAANTPVDKRVLKNYNDITLKYFGNPNSTHSAGANAKKEIDKATKKIANYFKTSKENIIYTSGASEANNLVIKGIAEYYQKNGKHIIISCIEHSSIIAPCNYLTSKGFEITIIPIDNNGKINLEKLKNALRKDTILVSICSVDSELGTIEPIKEVANLLKNYPNTFFHTDATQAIGKINLDFEGLDFLTFAPHKFYGLNGMGVLINFHNTKITPLIHGGKSTTVYRSGTPIVANITATEKALSLITKNLDKKINYISSLKEYLTIELKKIPTIHINSPKESIPNTLNISIKNSKKIINKLNKNEIYVSKQTACSLGKNPSKSVLALTGNQKLAQNTIRISLSHLTTKKELKTFIKVLKEEIYENN